MTKPGYVLCIPCWKMVQQEVVLNVSDKSPQQIMQAIDAIQKDKWMQVLSHEDFDFESLQCKFCHQSNVTVVTEENRTELLTLLEPED